MPTTDPTACMAEPNQVVGPAIRASGAQLGGPANTTTSPCSGSRKS